MSEAAADVKSKRRWYQYSLMSLFVATTAVAVCMATVRTLEATPLFWLFFLGVVWTTTVMAIAAIASRAPDRLDYSLGLFVAFNMVNWVAWCCTHSSLYYMSRGLEDEDICHGAAWLLDFGPTGFLCVAVLLTGTTLVMAWKRKAVALVACVATGTLFWFAVLGFGFLIASISLIPLLGPLYG